MYKLSKEDKQILREWGNDEEDIDQIERFMNHMDYKINDKKATLKQVKEVLDKKTLLSGLDRATFHWSCGRENDNGDYVSFNSHRYWNKILKEEGL